MFRVSVTTAIRRTPALPFCIKKPYCDGPQIRAGTFTARRQIVLGKSPQNTQRDLLNKAAEGLNQGQRKVRHCQGQPKVFHEAGSGIRCLLALLPDRRREG